MKTIVEEYYPGDARGMIRDLDLVLFRGARGARRFGLPGFVKRYTGSEYTHVGLAIWWNDRLMIVESISGGVVANRLSHRIDNCIDGIDIFRYPSVDEQRISFALSYLNQPYDYVGVLKFWLSIILGIDMTADTSYAVFCSEFVGRTLEVPGADFVSPKKLAEMSNYIFSLRR